MSTRIAIFNTQLWNRSRQDYTRKVELLYPTQRMLLLTAIANPSRLDSYLPNVVGKIILKDHSYFDKTKILEVLPDFDERVFIYTVYQSLLI